MTEQAIRNLLAEIAAEPADAYPTADILRRVRRRRLRNGGGVFVLGFAVIVGLVAGADLARKFVTDAATPPADSGAATPTLTSVPPNAIAASCCALGLRPPSNPRPPISKTQADRLALTRSFPPGSVVVESVLASTPKLPNIWLPAGASTTDFWVVSIRPPNDPGDPANFEWALVFIDAHTGSWLSLARGSGDPSGGYASFEE